MEVSLVGRTAVITGGSKGIGLAIAKRFAASGADVAIIARGRGALDEAVKSIGAGAKGRVAAIAGDVGVAADIKRAYDEAMAALGKIDIVVNNAGTSRTGAFEEITDEVWRDDFDQKLFAAIRLTRLVWPQMKERRWGRVINTLNIGAKAPRARSAPTSITRAAGLALTKVLSGEGAPHNVLVNALLVGFIEADQHVQAAAKAGDRAQGLHRHPRQGGPARPDRARRGVRQHRLLPRLRRRLLHHRHRHQRRRRALPGGLGRVPARAGPDRCRRPRGAYRRHPAAPDPRADVAATSPYVADVPSPVIGRASFDHLVCDGEQRQRHFQVECLRSF